MFGQNTGGGLFSGNSSGGFFGQNMGGGAFAQNTGGGMFGQNAGGGLCSGNSCGGLFGPNSNGFSFQNTGSGLFSQNAGTGMLGQNIGGTLFGQSTSSGLFSQCSGGVTFGQNTGGGVFSAGTSTGLFGVNTGGGLLGMNSSSGGDLAGFGKQQMAQMQLPTQDSCGLGAIVPDITMMPPRPSGLSLPRRPSKSSAAYLWKSQPESAAKLNLPGAPASRSASGAVFPEAIMDPTPTSRSQTTPLDISAASLLQIELQQPRMSVPPLAIGPNASASHAFGGATHQDPVDGDYMPPLHRPQDTLMPGTDQIREAWSDSSTQEAAPQIDVKVIKPNFVRRDVDKTATADERPVATSLVPRLSRSDYYCTPSIEMMSKMSEVKLSCVDNLEIGRYGCGSIVWPGLTDVRRLDFDKIVVIERGALFLYPDNKTPQLGKELNKDAMITLHVKVPKDSVSPEQLDTFKDRLAVLSEKAGGEFVSYDFDKWIFRLPHFNAVETPSSAD